MRCWLLGAFHPGERNVQAIAHKLNNGKWAGSPGGELVQVGRRLREVRNDRAHGGPGGLGELGLGLRRLRERGDLLALRVAVRRRVIKCRSQSNSAQRYIQSELLFSVFGLRSALDDSTAHTRGYLRAQQLEDPLRPQHAGRGERRLQRRDSGALLDVPWWLRRVHRAAVRLAVEYDVLHLAEGGADILDCHRQSSTWLLYTDQSGVRGNDHPALEADPAEPGHDFLHVQG